MFLFKHHLTLLNLEGVAQDVQVAEVPRHSIGGTDRVHNSCRASPVRHLRTQSILLHEQPHGIIGVPRFWLNIFGPVEVELLKWVTTG